jgi:hypothetical protein
VVVVDFEEPADLGEEGAFLVPFWPEDLDLSEALSGFLLGFWIGFLLGFLPDLPGEFERDPEE